MTARALTLALALAAAVATAAASGVAHADRREASLHAELVGGALATGDTDAPGATSLVPLAGLAARASYATHDAYQYDVALTLLRAGEAAFGPHTFTPAGRPPVSGPYQVGALLARVDGGVTLRLGVRWIPTVRLAAGVQLRRLGEAEVTTPGGTLTGRDAGLAFELIGAGAIGLDHRVNRRLIVGISTGVSLAVPVSGPPARTVELTLHGAYYWYPRW